MALGTEIIIIGCGPRGLSLALYAIYKGLSVTLIDPEPLKSWSSLELIPDLRMRSPASFDLVTGLEELQEFSFCNFLGQEFPFTTSQFIIENYHYTSTRKEFYDYLQFTFSYLKDKVTLIEESVKSIYSNYVITQSGMKYEANLITMCTGVQNASRVPEFIKLSNYQDKVINLNQLLKTYLVNKNILVVGSGQGAAEIVEYSAKLGAKVSWSSSKEAKINQYPAPSTCDWGSLSALGSYYSTLKTTQQKLNYLMKIKAWQPSITPYISQKLNKVKYDKNLPNLKDVDYTLLTTGLDVDFKKLPFNVNIEADPNLPLYPKLERGFRSCTAPTIAFSGNLALAYDGPRQGSLISAGLTSKAIINEYLQSSTN